MSLIKAVTITFLGMALAYSVYCSGSIFTSVLMHLCNNVIAVVLEHYMEPLQKICPFLFEETLSVPVCAGMILIAVVCIGIGIVLLRKAAVKVENSYE